MFTSSRKVFVWVLVVFVSLAVSSSAFAEEGKTLTGFLKKLFHVPVKTTQEVAGVTANTVQNTGEKVLSKTGENLAQGNVPQAAVQAVVVGPAETVGQTVAETVSIPANVAASSPTDAQKPAESK